MWRPRLSFCFFLYASVEQRHAPFLLKSGRTLLLRESAWAEEEEEAVDAAAVGIEGAAAAVELCATASVSTEARLA